MGEGYKIRDQFGIHHLTFTIVEWLHVFENDACCDIIIESLKYCQKEKFLNVHAYVIMPSHVHLMASSEVGNLSGTLRDLKTYTSRNIYNYWKDQQGDIKRRFMSTFRASAARRAKNTDFQVWMQRNHPIHLYTNKFILQRLNYIHENPVKDGLVLRADQYKYSSAATYLDKGGLLEIVKIEQAMRTFY